jgi:hypothetical protein
MKHRYDEATRELRMDFDNGQSLVVGNVSKEKAGEFVEKHAAEFERRECRLETAGAVVRRA